MKTTLYKYLFILLLIPCIGFSNNPSLNGKHTKQKKVTKEYTVSKDALLKIQNSYGNIDITTWNENRIVIEVRVKTNGDDEQKVQEKLDNITVDFNQTNEGVSAKTIFEKQSNNSSWWSFFFGSSNNVNMEVNYIIKAPQSNSVDIDNNYGGIFIDKLTGNARINCDYGKIDIGELRGDSNYINFDYTRNSHIGYVKNAIINADYSDFTIDEAVNVDLNADYTQSKFKKVESLKFNCDYGSITVDKVRRITGDGDYLSTKIGQLFQSASLTSDYGSLSIDSILKGVKDVSIKSNYASVKLGYAASHAFNFDINASYAGVKGIDSFELNKQNESGSKKNYSGYHLNNNSSNTVSIQSSYGNITFLNN